MKMFITFFLFISLIVNATPQNENVSIFKLSYNQDLNYFRLELSVNKQSLNKLAQTLSPGDKKFKTNDERLLLVLNKYINSTFKINLENQKAPEFFIKEIYDLGTQKVIVLESNTIKPGKLLSLKNRFLLDLSDDQINVIEFDTGKNRILEILSKHVDSIGNLSLTYN